MTERRLLATVALAAALVPLNSTMIVVAIPTLIDDFDASVSAAAWLVTSYLVAMAVLQPLAGRLGDRVGRRATVLGGLVWFGAASAAAAVAPNLELLVVCRVQQAVAGALLFPNAMAALREAIPPERLGRGVGTVSAALPLAAAAGPPLAGGLIAAFGWHAIFLVNLPLVAAALVLAGGGLPGRDSEPGPATQHERRRLTLLRRPAFLVPASAIALSNLAMYVTLLALPLLLDRRGGWSTGEIGLALATVSAGAFLLAPVGGRLADRAGRRLPALVGCALIVAGLLPLALVPDTISAVPLAATLAVMGTGLGLATPSLQVSAVEAVAVSAAGAASGAVSTSRYAGSIAGTLLLAGPLAPAMGLDGFGLLFAVLVGCASGAALLSLALPSRRHAPVPAVLTEA